ncbi:30S ribosomal protein S20 [Haloglycomyces albus]|uniref:30S ribosomal protein S20 n=1 Tax=Haloglycomyces albus TaxID=526067 RepID=UPI00046D3EAB|nr:30S ribosomal protein S20 [Haloglycomyces albus]
MANIKSKEKRNRQNEKRRLRNKAVKSSLKTSIRKFRAAEATGDIASAKEHLQIVGRQLDKAASKGVIHKNQAAQRKSKLARSLNKLEAAA